MLALATQALPEVGGSRVVSIRSVVDFPAPFGPRKATSSPAATSMSTPFTASTVSFLLTKCLVSRSVWITPGWIIDTFPNRIPYAVLD
jgi:hypothetical protein